MFADHLWQVVQAVIQDEPIIIRTNNALRPFIGLSDHMMKIGFAIPLNNPAPGQMVDPAEKLILNDIEDSIFAALKAKGSVVQALVITTGTFAEYIYYAQPSLDIATIHQRLQNSIQSHEIQCIAEIEEDWDTFIQWGNGDGL